MRWLGLLALVAASAALAQVEPIPSPGNSRIGIVHYSSDQPIRLQASIGSDLTILWPAAEHIQSVTVSDPNAYQVTVSENQDSLFVRAVRPAASVSMAVSTEARLYEIILSSAVGATAIYLVKIDNTAQLMPPAVWQPPVIRVPGHYKLSGNKALQPTSMRDDGAKIYIEWGADQAIPAVFALDDLGQEQMVNGYMRGQIFTLDRVFDHLVFRIDRAEAAANRIFSKMKK